MILFCRHYFHVPWWQVCHLVARWDLKLNLFHLYNSINSEPTHFPLPQTWCSWSKHGVGSTFSVMRDQKQILKNERVSENFIPKPLLSYKKIRGIPGDPNLGHGPSPPEDFETNSLQVKEKGVPVWCSKLSFINLKYLDFNQILVNIKSGYKSCYMNHIIWFILYDSK